MRAPFGLSSAIAFFLAVKSRSSSTKGVCAAFAYSAAAVNASESVALRWSDDEFSRSKGSCSARQLPNVSVSVIARWSSARPLRLPNSVSTASDVGHVVGQCGYSKISHDRRLRTAAVAKANVPYRP
jgi:hypothetical protein